jgi:CheY-like chemotaxis protein
MRTQKRTKILVVEDEFLVSAMISDALADHGFDVRAVSNAEDALRELEAGEGDILFTDIDLPGDIDGVTLARYARRMRPRLPVVYASAVWPGLDRRRAVPGSVFLSKPYDPHEVCVLIARLAATLH